MTVPRLLFAGSVLDLAICSRSMAGHLTVAVADDLRGSDHLPILVGASLSGPLRSIRESLPGCVRRAASSPPVVVSGVYGRLLGAWNLPNRKRVRGGSSSRSNPPWWTDACTVAVRDRRRAYRRFRRWEVGERWEVFLEASRTAKQIIRGAKRSYGARLCAAVGSGLSLAEVWRRVSPDRNNRPVVSWVFSSDGREVLRGVQMAEAFADRFVSVYDCPRGVVCPLPALMGGPYDAAVDAPFTAAEVRGVLEGCKDGATGLDRVSYADIRSLDDGAMGELLGFLNLVYEGAEPVPEAWKFAVLVPLCKAGKERFLVSNYRPISLLSCVSKVYERMIAARLTWFLERHDCLEDAQFGFRRNRSAEDAVL